MVKKAERLYLIGVERILEKFHYFYKMKHFVFKELQKFPWWIYLFTLLPLLIIVSLAVKFYFEENYSDITGLAFVLIVMVVVNLFLFIATLKTKIDSEGIHIKFAPFTNRKILWTNVESAEVVKYGFVGYGWRFSFKYGRVYNTKGNMGLFIITKKKKKILVGTQQPEKLASIINKQLGSSI